MPPVFAEALHALLSLRRAAAGQDAAQAAVVRGVMARLVTRVKEELRLRAVATQLPWPLDALSVSLLPIRYTLGLSPQLFTVAKACIHVKVPVA
jgi:hypothetical protein